MIFSEMMPAFDGKDQPEYHFEGSFAFLSNLSKINIFVGANNSGKSKLLRELFALRKVRYKLFGFNKWEIENAYDEFNRGLSRLPEYDAMRINFSNGHFAPLVVDDWIDYQTDFEKYKKWVEGVKNDLRYHDTLYSDHILNRFAGELERNIAEGKSIQNNLSTCYVPILRGLRPLDFSKDNSTVSEDSYALRSHIDYQWNIDEKRNILFTGLDLYNVVRDHLLGDQSKRKKIRDFEDFLKEQFFLGKDISLVPRHDSDVLYINIGGDERPIYDLGDGIQSIIILTYPLFFSQDQYTAFFFEEPETHLHPGLQRVFIDALLRQEFSKFQYFFTTHSNHFLDLTLEYDNISVYSFEKGEKDGKSVFNVKNVNQGDTSVLSLLGVRNSSVFLSNCTIWVEGITDRLYIRKYLELYQKEIGGQAYKEDLHYSFVEYGGGNITHWSFLDDDQSDSVKIDVERLCGKLFLITDKDDVKAGAKAERQQILAKRLKERYYCLEAREIENLLSTEVVKRTIISYNPKNRDLDYSQFESKYDKSLRLGEFIDNSVLNLSRKFSDKDGVLIKKPEFCQRAIRCINSFEEMTDEAKDLAKRIYQFIESNNK